MNVLYSPWIAFAGMFALMMANPARVGAQGSLGAVQLSSDTTIDVGGAVLTPDSVGQDDLGGTFAVLPLGLPIPQGVDLVGYDHDGMQRYFTADVALTLPSGAVAEARDVVAVGPVGAYVAFDGSSLGIPPGVRVDAVAVDQGDWLLSFDVGLDLAGTPYGDEDLVRFDGNGGVSMAFDASNHFSVGALDLDAADALSTGTLLLSFDGHGRWGSAGAFADEDLLEFDRSTGQVRLALDASANESSWVAAELDAVAASLDSDGDGMLDAEDSCPFVPDTGIDRGGVGFGSLPDGIGDACQCGDVSGDGFVTGTDALMIRRALLVPPSATLVSADLCDVGGGAGCTTGDALIIRRALLVPPSATVLQRCGPALP